MMAEVYTDRDQCRMFNVSYYDREATLIVCADVLLESKDYDREHRELLEPYGSTKLVLKRTLDHGPGWWAIVPDAEPWTPAKAMYCKRF